MNEETRYVINLLISMIPIAVVGFFFKDAIEGLFTSNLVLVGIMLLVTACLLTFAGLAKPRTGTITPKNAFIIGLAQALAVLPGLSRSGTTISTGLLLGVQRSEVSKFSFLMVLVPIIGMNLLEPDWCADGRRRHRDVAGSWAVSPQPTSPVRSPAAG